MTSCVLSCFILSPHYPGFSFLCPLLLPSVVNGLWKMLGVERLPHSLGKRGVFPSQGGLVVFVPHALLNHREQPPASQCQPFQHRTSEKKGLKSCPLPKAPFSRHMDRLHPGYLPINLWFLWEIARHVMYSRYKKHNFGPSVRSVIVKPYNCFLMFSIKLCTFIPLIWRDSAQVGCMKTEYRTYSIKQPKNPPTIKKQESTLYIFMWTKGTPPNSIWDL